MHVVDIMRVELAAYHIKNVFRTLFDKWKWVRELRVHHLGVGHISKWLSFGDSFPRN